MWECRYFEITCRFGLTSRTAQHWGRNRMAGLTSESTLEPGLFLVGGVVKSQLGAKDRQVAKDHIAALLQVQNLVVLIGSGASFHLGSPKTRSMTNKGVTNLIADAGQLCSERDEELLQVINPDDSGDLEKLLNGLQLATSLAQQTGLGEVTFGSGDSATSFTPEEIGQLRRKINVAFANACRLPKPDCALPDPLRAHRKFFSRLVGSRRANLPRPKIFTTNYDLVIEKSLDELGYPYIDGFSGTVDRRLNLAFYGLDFHRVESATQQVVARAESALYLHKIHGSLNWVARVGRTGGMATLDVVQVPEERAGSSEPVLIYPTTAKEGETLSYPYSDLMRSLGDAVQQNDTAVISVGYGFADPHINRILLRSMAINPAIHVLAVDPFAVLEDDHNSKTALLDEELVGKTLGEKGYTLKETPFAALAAGDDSRIAVLTGPAGKFEAFVGLLPEPSLSTNFKAPTEVMKWIESMERMAGKHLAGAEENDA